MTPPVGTILKMCAAYGCSLGGSFVALLIARQNIIMEHGIIGSSDFDQSGIISARLKAALMGKVLYPYIHTGKYSISFMQKKMGEKYLTRYKQHFQNPVIHEHNMRHEELLGVYPEQWAKLVKEICLS